jgi:hypothetical protein
MSISSPFECRIEAGQEPLDLVLVDALGEVLVGRTGHSPSRAYGVRAPQGSAMRA